MPKGLTHEAAHSLCTLLQNAECPKAFKMTIIESVEAYEKESNLLKIYKEKCNLLGRYALDFLDLIEVHQVFSEKPFVEALHLFESHRKLVLVLEISEPLDFVVNWDRNLEILYDELRSPSFGGLYCGAGIMNGAPMPSFTTNTSGVIESWPLWRFGPPMQVMWPVSPILVEYNLFKQLSGGSFNEAIDVDRQFWTTREPVALVKRECFPSKTRPPISKALGLSLKAEHLEIIMKYGSLAALKWASNGH